MVQATLVSDALFTVAVKFWVAPLLTDALAGSMLTDTSGAAVTVTVASAYLVGSALEVARTVMGPVSSVPKVSRPLARVVLAEE